MKHALNLIHDPMDNTHYLLIDENIPIKLTKKQAKLLEYLDKFQEIKGASVCRDTSTKYKY